jgi:hypothetical protein
MNTPLLHCDNELLSGDYGSQVSVELSTFFSDLKTIPGLKTLKVSKTVGNVILEFENDPKPLEINVRRMYYRKCHQKRLSDKEVNQVYTTLVEANWPFAIDQFELVDGEDILEAYKQAYGKNSCMTDDDYEKTTIYAENPDKVKMLKYRSCDGKECRALVWFTDCGTTVVDRIYPNDSQHHVDRIITWAYENDYVIRGSHSAVFPGFVDKNGPRGSFAVTLDSPSNELYPFMDSFRFTKISEDEANENGEIKLSSSEKGYCLDSLDGHYSEKDTARCDCCDEYYDTENMRSVANGDFVCQECLENEYFYCEINEDYYHNDQMNVIHNSRGHQIVICDDAMDNIEVHDCPCCDERFTTDI